MEQQSLFSNSNAPVPVQGALQPDDESPEQRYWRQMRPLFREALDRREVEAFADAVSYALAIIANWYPGAAGDVLRRLGRHVCDVAEQSLAEREAEEARRAGRRPQ